ncbi:leucine-trna ligase [Phaffia rhodozyma]|uniref:leucine--tRNA ligase n=1 Tax=Phaffia rhodozyma TaxID=264483 RepID=A0A0F7SJW3_PHARH|nr:leucine-trna ligase [Phaffia rhodozyma]
MADSNTKVDMMDKVKVGPLVLENTFKRDHLIKIEKDLQARWQEEKLFEINPPSIEELSSKELTPSEIQAEHPKWMGTFPYPYMNGSLHLGHAFTISKIEFATGFQRMLGKRALFPMGLHCTGMPIKAAADKLIREMEMFGPEFEGYDPENPVPQASAAPPPANKVSDAQKDPSKATKGKIAGKATGLTYQFQIMESIGVPREEIKKFADPLHWLQYFPPIARKDCTEFGARIDWRRTFITTDQNPYYDSFVRWQMNKLHAQKKIKFGKRNTIYSIKDGQPCMDHDRSGGEAVGPQEYTGLKMEVTHWPEAAKQVLNGLQGIEGKKVYMVAATLRPETMYGQTNCFVGTNITYGFFEAANNEVFIISERAARNMAYQGIFAEEGKINKLGEIKGDALVGTKIKAPHSVYEEVWVLPMDGVLATKGTGVVTSVPSDSPDDYATLMDLRKKAEFYKIQPEWASNEPISVITTPNYGGMIAATLCQQMKIQSQKDVKQLAEAKDIAYKEGFFNGTMAIGEFKGEAVQTAKTKVRDSLIEKNLAFKYAEPESLVTSRSGDECIVALVDQWYIDYGEEEWKQTAKRLLSQMNTYFNETRNGFEGVLDWLKQWACSRSYGLGSRIPWDPQFLVESLSDSTIYMSYYTVAYLLQGGDITGKTTGPAGISPADMTDEAWEYVLGSGSFPASSNISQETFDKLKREFQYFYPMDVRSSGKDLIPNHLTFCIYVHAALFPEHHWPQAMRANGHLMLNGKKMAKSTGNSLTLEDSVKKFGADATRLTLADAGDGIEDANFEELTANSAIQRLYTQLAWIEETLANKSALRTGPKDSYWDKVFEEEMNDLAAKTKDAYEKTWYKEALQYGYYGMDNARRSYTEMTSDVGMHYDVLLECIRYTALLVTPIIPHFADHLWTTVLQNSSSIQKARFPEIRPIDKEIINGIEYIRAVLKDTRDRQIALDKKKGKGKGPVVDKSKPLGLRLFIAKTWPAWQNTVLEAVKSSYDEKTDSVDDVKVRVALTEAGLIKNKKAMPYAITLKKRIAEFGATTAFTRTLPFSEIDTLSQLLPHMEKSLKLVSAKLMTVEDAQALLESGVEKDGENGFSQALLDDAQPGSPTSVFYNI